MAVYLVHCRACEQLIASLGTQGGLRAAVREIRDHRGRLGHESTLYLASAVPLDTDGWPRHVTLDDARAGDEEAT